MENGRHRVWVACLATVLAAGCTAGNTDPGSGPSPRGVDTAKLDASVTQHRYAEGTRDLLAGVTNNSGRALDISSATIRWAGLDFPTVTVAEPVVPPGQTAAFTVRYGAPHCGVRQPGPPTLVTVVDGAEVVLPLRVEGPGLLRRLRDKACAQQTLGDLASVSLRLATRTQVVRGTEVLPGRVVVRRRADRRGTVTVDDLGGSVLFAVEPREGPRALPARLADGQPRLSVPVLVRSAGRCDPHSRSQSSQTFLFSVYVHRDADAVLRLIQVPELAEQERLLAMLDRVCR